MRYALLLLLLTGCATPAIGQTPYRPNVGGDGYGYSEMYLNASTVQVTFVAVTASDAQEGAMYRAAEVALERGADGFVISGRDDSFDQVTRKRLVVGRVRRNLPVTTLTIVLLMRGDFARVPPGTMVYDAHMLAGGAPRR